MLLTTVRKPSIKMCQYPRGKLVIIPTSFRLSHKEEDQIRLLLRGDFKAGRTPRHLSK